jgi:anti-anti-sigma regulatory factor
MTTSTCLLLDRDCPLQTLQEATAVIAGATSELLLDFSAVERIDAKALIAIEELAERAEQAEVAVVFRGVNVRVYKVLKLVRLASKFSFVSFDN